MATISYTTIIRYRLPSSSLMAPIQHIRLYHHNRCMWAGSEMSFMEYCRLRVRGWPNHCTERVVDVETKGDGPKEKIIVAL